MTVTNTMVDLSGQPSVLLNSVFVELVPNNGNKNRALFDPTTGFEVVPYGVDVPIVNSAWSLSLKPNGEYYPPSQSYYRVVEQNLSAMPGSFASTYVPVIVRKFVVPVGGGPYLLRDILINDNYFS